MKLQMTTLPVLLTAAALLISACGGGSSNHGQFPQLPATQPSATQPTPPSGQAGVYSAPVDAADKTANDAADVQSVINVWHAYAAQLDSQNAKGVASLMTPTGGYTLQQDTQSMQPSACAPQPGGTTPCINTGGCVALGSSGIQKFLPAVGYRSPQPWAGTGQHQLANPVVELSDDRKSAKLYIYFNFGRYINELVKTDSGWKVQWERIIWPNIGGFSCRTDWSQATNKDGLLGTDLYYLRLPVGGPQVVPEIASRPGVKKANGLVEAAVQQVNAQKYADSCTTINQLMAHVRDNADFDAAYKEYLLTIGGRYLEDAGCDGRTPPDRTKSNGKWAATAAWQGYQLSAGSDKVTTPANVDVWSAAAVAANN